MWGNRWWETRTTSGSRRNAGAFPKAAAERGEPAHGPFAPRGAPRPATARRTTAQ
ncbi:hypothetical protein GCM10027168_67200 [Streptomyces capparidis]